MIPENPVWCSRCRQAEKGVCEAHRGPDGEPAPYQGADRYEPSEWVLSVVRRRYVGYHDGRRVFVCVGYDPRHGFWMQSRDDGAPLEINVSERAIDRTFHPVRMSYGAWRLLEIVERLGRFPTAKEADGVLLDLATETLHDHGFLGRKDNTLTEEGRAILAQYPDEENRHGQIRVV